MTKEKIAGFLFGVGVGTALGFFLRDDVEENGRHTAGDPEHRRGKASSKVDGHPLQTHAPGLSADVQEDRTVLAI
jgi:hypothetical protein